MLLIPVYAAAVPGLLLDDISSLGPAYSFRKLVTAYEGNCVRIRRSSDNAEQDFGFVSNVADTAGIASFVGGGNGFIVTWYDQSGGSLDVTNATAANQPAFISSGINSLPTARFDGSNDVLEKASVAGSSLFNSNEMTFIAVLKQDGAQAQNAVFNWTVTTNNRTTCYATYDNVIYYDFGDFGGSGRVSGAQPGGWDDAGHVLEGYRATGGTQQILVDGTSIVSASRSGGPTGGPAAWQIGIEGSIIFKGDLSELILTKNDTGSTNRATIRKNGVGTGVSDGMGDYYGITVV